MSKLFVVITFLLVFALYPTSKTTFADDVALLIEALKAQQVQIEELKAEIDAMKEIMAKEKEDSLNDSLDTTAASGYEEEPETTSDTGIGTNSPEVDLHIYAQDQVSTAIRLEGNSLPQSAPVPYREFTTITRDADALRFTDDDNGESFTIMETGEIGINTPDPEVDVHVYTRDEKSSSIRLEGNSKVDGSYRENTTITRDGSALRFVDDDTGEVVTIKENGNVGLGDPTPTEKLEVAGTVKATNFKGDGSLLTNLPPGPKGDKGDPGKQGTIGPQGPIGATGPRGKTGLQGPIGPQGIPGVTGATGPQGPAGDSHWLLDGLNTSYNAGNVGIGTANPLYDLHVSKKGETVTAYISSDDNRLTGFGFNNSDGKTGKWFFRRLPNENDLKLYNFGTASDIMTWDFENGYIGMGTTSPDRKLTVQGKLFSGGDFGLEIDGSTLKGALAPGVAALIGDIPVTINAPGQIVTSLKLQTGGNDRLTIDANGKVGIGTSSPDEKLHVKGVSLLDTVRLGDTGGNGVFWDLEETDNNDFTLEYGSEMMRVTASGNVGIGTSTPSQKLTVAGTIELISGGIKFPDGTIQTTAAVGAPVAKTGQTTSYATGDDGDLQKGVAWPNPRFTDNGNGTVRDNLTGLIWTKDANLFGNQLWKENVESCNTLADSSTDNGPIDGSAPGDWRLANFNELLSLIDRGQADQQSLPDGHPFVSVSDAYWSSTTYAKSPNQAWITIMKNGGLMLTDPKQISGGAVRLAGWCVRGGQ